MINSKGYRIKAGSAFLCLLLPLIMLWGCGGPAQEAVPESAVSSEAAFTQSDTAAEPDSAAESDLGAIASSDSPVAAEQSQQKTETPAAEPEQQTLVTPEPASESAPPPGIRLVMVGDILLHTPLAESGKTQEGSYDISAIFDNLKEEIQAADVALVNQEVIIGGAELGVSGYPSFNAPYELGDALMDAGFDIVLHATNHALDKERKGL